MHEPPLDGGAVRKMIGKCSNCSVGSFLKDPDFLLRQAAIIFFIGYLQKDKSPHGIVWALHLTSNQNAC